MNRFGPADCLVCGGAECKGGGFLKCKQRDPRVSRIASILDPYGGLRVVVAYEETFHHHVRCDEFLFVSKKHKVHEPIGWNDIPMVCRVGDWLVEQWIKRYGLSNDPNKRNALKLWQLRQLEHPSSGSFHLPDIVQT
jgi:hypothetical protein